MCEQEEFYLKINKQTQKKTHTHTPTHPHTHTKPNHQTKSNKQKTQSPPTKKKKVTKHRTKGFFHFQNKNSSAAALLLKSSCNMSDRKRLNSKVSRVTLAKHSGPLCTGDWWGWSFAQGSRAPPRLMVWKDYSEKLLLCQCQVRASDNAELDDASFMLLSYEAYEFHNVKSSVWHISTFFFFPDSF